MISIAIVLSIGLMASGIALTYFIHSHVSVNPGD